MPSTFSDDDSPSIPFNSGNDHYLSSMMKGLGAEIPTTLSRKNTLKSLPLRALRAQLVSLPLPTVVRPAHLLAFGLLHRSLSHATHPRSPNLSDRSLSYGFTAAPPSTPEASRSLPLSPPLPAASPSCAMKVYVATRRRGRSPSLLKVSVATRQRR
ncbi:hypothetical protein PIB30_100311 [Stylosanthes scabra]|uniref:Uncharacterized protein n=1 Tax=Stylosanthes scabra TaxID=79078 RepID=A0ABU6ZVW3_9FABA|nr:hypothetical protein [Stylosanthes scabra]